MTAPFTMTDAEIARLLVRGRAGYSMIEIASEFALNADQVEAAWRSYSSPNDHDRRARSMNLFTPDLTVSSLRGGLGANARRETIDAGRSGVDFVEIGRLLGIHPRAARKRWQKYAEEDDKAAREAAVKACAAEKAAARAEVQSEPNRGAPVKYEPPVPRPLKEFPACTFSDDPRAKRDRGTARMVMPARETWALGGSSLA
jgi:hypothetical protein